MHNDTQKNFQRLLAVGFCINRISEFPRPVRLTSVRESGFADGRHEVSPDSERNETTKPQAFCRVSVSVEQIQDRVRVRG